MVEMVKTVTYIECHTREENQLLFDIVGAYVEALGGSVAFIKHDIRHKWPHVPQLWYEAEVPVSAVHKINPFIDMIQKLWTRSRFITVSDGGVR